MPAKGVQTTPPSRTDTEAFLFMASPGIHHALIVGDGDVPACAALDAAWPGWADGADLVIAADGGFRKAAGAGLRGDLLVGDGDSLGPDGGAEARAAGVPVEFAEVAKDETDVELALLAAVARGAARITILGALGGPRFDHALANVWLLAHPGIAGGAAVLLDATTRIRLLSAGAGEGSAAATLAGTPGDLVSLLPFGGDAEGVTTSGLAAMGRRRRARDRGRRRLSQGGDRGTAR